MERAGTTWRGHWCRELNKGSWEAGVGWRGLWQTLVNRGKEAPEGTLHRGPTHASRTPSLPQVAGVGTPQFTSPIALPSQHQVLSQGSQKASRVPGRTGLGETQPPREPWGARPRPPAPAPLPAPAGCGRDMRTGRPGAGRREAGERACSSSLPGAGAGRSGRARRGAGPPGAGAGRGSGKRAPSAAAGGVKCARTQRLTASLERSVPGMRTAGSHRATVPRELWRQ